MPAEQHVLQQLRFEKADYFVSNNSAFNQALSEEQRVELYASRQQALVGPNAEPQPSKFSFGNSEVKKRWAAWAALGAMPQAEAMDRYAQAVGRMEPAWAGWEGFPSGAEDGNDDLTEEALSEATTVIQAQLRRAAAEVAGAGAAAQAAALTAGEMALAEAGDRAVAVLQRAGSAWLVVRRAAEAEAAVAAAEKATLENFWQLLLQGMSVVKWSQGSAKPAPRVLWLGRDGTRLFCAPRKLDSPTGSTKGLFLRDVSDVRVGQNTATFKRAATDFRGNRVANGALPPPDVCFSLVGTERTLDLQLPSAAACTGLASRFRALIAKLSASTEKATAHRWGAPAMSFAEVAQLAHFTELMMQGIEVFKYDSNGKKTRRVLWLARKRVFIDSKKRQTTTIADKGIDMDDITEVRPGINSHAFNKCLVRPHLTAKCFSIIGSERTINVEVPSQALRDTLVQRLQLLMREHAAGQHVNASPPTAPAAMAPAPAPAPAPAAAVDAAAGGDAAAGAVSAQ